MYTASESVWARKRAGRRIRRRGWEAEGWNFTWAGSTATDRTGNLDRVCLGGVGDCPAGWWRRTGSVNSCAAARHDRLPAGCGGWHRSAASRTYVAIHVFLNGCFRSFRPICDCHIIPYHIVDLKRQNLLQVRT